MELYIHIPFCVRKCAYCAFDSYPGCSREEMEQYISAVLREAQIQRKYLTEPVQTVYIGGGTPSILPPDLMEKLLAGLKSVIGLDSVMEFTVEANPGTVTVEWLDMIRRFGANRISLGMQAAQEPLLQMLGRIHDPDDVFRSVENARSCGFSNISLDLMFGIPGQRASDWRQTLETAVSLSPNHISAYGLIPEEGTPLFQKLSDGILSLPEPDDERDMYDSAIVFLSRAGLCQYEISNFAKPGFECRHNIGYWDQVPYLGLGLSAASMIRCSCDHPDRFSVRWTNPGSLDDYYGMVGNPEKTEKIKETVSAEEARFETVMLSLRMTGGMRRARFAELHGNPPEYWYQDALVRLRKHGLLELSDDSWRLTRRGMDIQNSVLLEFME